MVCLCYKINCANNMKTSLIVSAVAVALFAAVTAIPIGCQHTGVSDTPTSRIATKKDEGTKEEAGAEDAEAAVLARLAKKIDELRQLKIASLKEKSGSTSKEDALSVPAKSVKSEIGADLEKKMEGPMVGGGDLQDVEEGEEETKAEQEREASKARSDSVSLRTVVRMAMLPKNADNSFLTDEEQKGLADYVRVKMLKDSRDVVRMPMNPVVRNSLPRTLSRLAKASNFLSEEERDSLSRLVRSNGFKIGGDANAAENDVHLGAFVRAALGGEADIIGKVDAAPGSPLSLKEAEKMSLTI